MKSHWNQVNNSLFEINEIKLLIVGSLQPGKGQIDAIKALRDLIDKGVKATLTIVGDGQDKYKTLLKEVINDLALINHVFLEGFRLSRCHCF